MKTRYGVVLINQTTGEVATVVSNDSPIPRASFPRKGHKTPSVPPIIYRYRRFEYDSEEHVRAHDFRVNMKVDGATLGDRQNPNATLDFSGLPEVARFEDKGNDNP